MQKDKKIELFFSKQGDKPVLERVLIPRRKGLIDSTVALYSKEGYTRIKKKDYRSLSKRVEAECLASIHQAEDELDKKKRDHAAKASVEMEKKQLAEARERKIVFLKRRNRMLFHGMNLPCANIACNLPEDFPEMDPDRLQAEDYSLLDSL